MSVDMSAVMAFKGTRWRGNAGQSALSSVQDDCQNCALAMCGFKPLI